MTHPPFRPAALVAALERKRWSYAECARRMGSTRASVRRWALGLQEPEYEHIEGLARVLDVAPETLSGRVRESTPVLVVTVGSREVLRMDVREPVTVHLLP